MQCREPSVHSNSRDERANKRTQQQEQQQQKKKKTIKTHYLSHRVFTEQSHTSPTASAQSGADAQIEKKNRKTKKKMKQQKQHKYMSNGRGTVL